MSVTITYIIIAISQIQRRFILHVSQHCVSSRLAEKVGYGSVLSPNRQMEGGAAVKHGSIHVGSPVEEQLHWCDVM